MAVSWIFISFQTLSLKLHGLKASTNTLLNDLPAADFYVPHMMPYVFEKGDAVGFGSGVLSSLQRG